MWLCKEDKIVDWRNRKYYCVSFDWSTKDMRIDMIRLIDSVKIRPYKEVPKQPDEVEERPRLYQFFISVSEDSAEGLEYELRKAERSDDFCKWKEIKQVFQKYDESCYDYNNFRRCQLNPHKRCNGCMNC